MKKPLPEEVEKCRVKIGPLATDSGSVNGAFHIHVRFSELEVVVSNNEDWEHLSFRHTRNDKPPTPEEARALIDMFWGEGKTVVEFHTPKVSPNVTHLWQPVVGWPEWLIPSQMIHVNEKEFSQFGLWDGLGDKIIHEHRRRKKLDKMEGKQQG